MQYQLTAPSWIWIKYTTVLSKKVEILRAYYDNTTSCVRTDVVEGDWFPLTMVLRLKMDALMAKKINGDPGGVAVGKKSVTDVGFADKMSLMTDT